jgi:hypothetical protein
MGRRYQPPGRAVVGTLTAGEGTRVDRTPGAVVAVGTRPRGDVVSVMSNDVVVEATTVDVVVDNEAALPSSTSMETYGHDPATK